MATPIQPVQRSRAPLRWRCACGREYQHSAPDLCRDCGSPEIRPLRPASFGPADRCKTYADAKRSEHPRWSTGMPALDVVLGGGIVRNSAILLAGKKGAGKSTMLAKLAGALTRSSGRPVLLASGEEQADQILPRAARLGEGGNPLVKVLDVDPVDVDVVCEQATLHRVAAVILDSIQKAIVRDENGRAMGGASRPLRAEHAAEKLTTFCKSRGIALVMIGQLDAAEDIAGTEALQHGVDVVAKLMLTLSTGDRWLTVEKNRFDRFQKVGAVLRLEMRPDGLQAVPRTSVEYLRDHHDGVAGSVVFPWAEESDVLLCALSARVFDLPTDDEGKPLFQTAPKRPVTGMGDHQAATLLQVLQAEDGYTTLRGRDVFVEASGEPGKRLTERASDLALAVAVVSSLKRRALPSRCAAFGVVGIHGDVQRAPRARQRLEACMDAGYRVAIVPRSDVDLAPVGIAVYGVDHVSEIDTVLAEISR